MIKRHGVATRLWHWVNALCLFVLLTSGLQIFNAHPSLYWGYDSSFDDPWLTMTAVRGPDGERIGVTRIADYRFNTTGVLGLSQFKGEPTVRGFPAWVTLPSGQWLAMGRYWHFAFAWICAPLLIAYLTYSLASGRRRRLIWPTAAQWKGLPRTIADHARLRFHHKADYNGLQKLTYLIALFGLLPLMIFTGLTMSPTMDAAWPWLLDVFFGRQSARTIHFLCAFALVAFFIIHIVLVLISGVFNNLRSMTTGDYKVIGDSPEDQNHA
ncbi:MAG: cytochrome b/b6 domain-containing protein [Nitrococcus sp.]|nr:cytochrome b/b6 domain-containing protein [Nitrococcus sp.]